MKTSAAQALSVRSLTTSRPAGVDVLRADNASAAIQLLGIVGFALLTAFGAQIRIYLWEVPITLQTVGVYGSGLFLGWRNGFLAQALYLLLGLFAPVFAGNGYGVAYLSGAVSAGYLLAYPVTAMLIGYLSARWNTLAGSTVSMIAGSLLMFAFGVSWLHVAAHHATWQQSIVDGWLRFVPIDLAKIMLIGIGYTGARFLSLRRG